MSSLRYGQRSWGLSLLCSLLTVSTATFTIVSPVGVFSGRAFYSTPWSTMTGPQAGDPGVKPITGEVFVFTGDPCDPTLFPAGLSGKVVLLPVGTGIFCFPPSIYRSFMAHNVTAVIQVYSYGLGSVPGVNAFARFTPDEDAEMRLGSMMYMSVQEVSNQGTGRSETVLSAYLATSGKGPVIVDLFPDVNKWVTIYEGVYPVFTRWIPSLGLMITALYAFFFLYQHVKLIIDNYIASVTTASTRTWKRHMKNLWSKCTIPHVVLLLEALTCMLYGVSLLWYSWYSSPFAYQYMLLFSTFLAGYEFASNILSARMWNLLSKKSSLTPSIITKPKSSMSKILSHPVVGPLIMMLPVIFDTIFSIMYAVGMVTPDFDSLVVLQLLIMQFCIGMYFLFQAHQFEDMVRTHITTTMETTLGHKSHQKQSPLRDFMIRLDRWKFRLGACMLIYVLTLTFAITPYLFTPVGWAIYMTIQLNVRFLASLCRVMSAKPNTPDAKVAPGAHDSKNATQCGISQGVSLPKPATEVGAGHQENMGADKNNKLSRFQSQVSVIPVEIIPAPALTRDILESINMVRRSSVSMKYAVDDVAVLPLGALNAMTSEAQYFFGAKFVTWQDSELLQAKMNTVRGRWIRFRHYFYEETYPESCNTPMLRLDEYFNRRQLNPYKTNWIQLVAFGVGTVISGEFSGYNYYVTDSGFIGFVVAFGFASLLYLSIALSLAEMSAAIPSSSGGFGFGRAIIGDVSGFIIGNSENLEYCMFVALLLAQYSDIATTIGGIDPVWSPLIWFVVLFFTCVIISVGSRATWHILVVGSAFCILQIIVFALIAAPTADPTWITVGWEQTYSTSSQQLWFGVGIAGSLKALHSTAWFFTGLECVSLTGSECVNRTRDVTRGLIASWALLFICGVLLIGVGFLNAPGVSVLSKSSYPMVDVVLALNPSMSRQWATLLILPCTFVNLIGVLLAAAKQTWALSRAGYLPQQLALTTNSNRTPRRALLFSCTYSFAMACFVTYIQLGSGGESGYDILLSLTLIASLVNYIGIGITYTVFKTQFPNAPRPFVSPLGISGGVVITIIAGTGLISKFALSPVFRMSIFVFVIKLAFSAAYYSWYGRFHLLPTPDYLMQSFWAHETPVV